MTSAAFDAYTERLSLAASADDRILGVVLLGSGADASRIDEWSDHDIALIVRGDAVADLRASVRWLPDGERLVAVGQEWHDGFKAVFDDGRVVEYAVTDIPGLATFPLAAARVVLDRGGVSDAVAGAIASTRTRLVSAPDALAAALLVQLLVGVGRLRRGERLSAGNVIRSEAALSFIDLWLAVCHPGESHPDPFDGRRRIERVDPEVARRLDDAMAQSTEGAARSILSLAEEIIAPAWPGWPAGGADAVRRRLGWST
ncbi:MAG: hypothetical protein J0J05_05320 [Microbacterium sp.]|uniref:hypothetical protein n=1 Tax=Microbacterium sp. TaxID=51671 RepID=UPI001ACB1121|nr:hypothetical protein [Microbacterium sp.]MBN9153384.1 hypothetical protein [Microbacterium sp.]